MEDLISKLSSQMVHVENQWKDQQCFTHIPKWQRWIMNKLPWGWVRNMFGYGFKSYRSNGADFNEPVQVKTIVFMKGEKEISSCNFIYKFNPTNEENKTSSLN